MLQETYFLFLLIYFSVSFFLFALQSQIQTLESKKKKTKKEKKKEKKKKRKKEKKFYLSDYHPSNIIHWSLFHLLNGTQLYTPGNLSHTSFILVSPSKSAARVLRMGVWYKIYTHRQSDLCAVEDWALLMCFDYNASCEGHAAPAWLQVKSA